MSVDWTIFHALNGLLIHRDGAQDAATTFNTWAIYALVGIAGLTWFFARPGGSVRSKMAAVSAAASGAVALLVNVLLGRLWFHDRPFVDHPRHTLLLIHHAADNSFPSDHASLAFAVAFSVLAFHRRLGLLLLLGAGCVGVDRIFVGVHYPLDVAASVGVGLCSALIVTTRGQSGVAWIVQRLSHLTDPVVGAAVARISAQHRQRAL